MSTPPGGVFAMLATSPEAMRRVSKLGAFARFGTSLPDLPREAAIYVTACREQFAAEVRIHGETAKRLGGDDALLDHLANGAFDQVPDRVQQAAIFAHTLATTGAVDQPVFDAARAAFGDRGVVDLAVTVGYYVLLARLNRVFAPE